MSSRERAAQRMVEMLDSPFFHALTEPARLAIVRVLLVRGPSDISAIAGQVPQDRSVVSRHLGTLEAAGIVRGHRAGRQRIFELDGPAFLATFERTLAEARALIPLCCPPPTDVVPATRLRRH